MSTQNHDLPIERRPVRVPLVDVSPHQGNAALESAARPETGLAGTSRAGEIRPDRGDVPAAVGLTMFALTAVLVTAAILVARVSTWVGSPQMHTVVEAISMTLAAFAAVVAVVRHQSRDDRVFLLIGAGFLGTAVLDGFHVVATTPGMADRLPSALSTLGPWSWLASRLCLSVCLYLSWLAWSEPERGRRVSDARIYLGVGTLILSSILFFSLVPLPPAYVPNWMLHRPAELLPAIFFTLALVGYVAKGDWRSDVFDQMLVCSLIVSVAIQIVVMPMSSVMFDPLFELGHVLKLVSYLLVVAGLIGSVSRAFADVRRLGETRAEAIQQLAVANEGLEAFVRSASHDLKAPVRHVVSFAGFINESADERLNAVEKQDLQRIMDAAAQMSELLDSLLRFAKLGATSLRYELIPLQDIVDPVVRQLPNDVQQSVHFNGQGTVWGDRALLTLVIQNLIENASKYVGQRPPEIQVTMADDEPGLVRVSVSDNGIGLPERDWQRVFQPGVRAVADADCPGTGFGLATCARVVQAHGGRIWIASNQQHGLTFHFTLPKQPATRAA